MYRKKATVIWNRNTDLVIKAIITEEACIKFRIHAISLDARVIIRPAEHTRAIWVLWHCKDKPREQGHTDLPTTEVSQTWALQGAIFLFSFLTVLLKKGTV